MKFINLLKLVFLVTLNFWIFSVCAPPSLVGAYYLHPPDAGAIFLNGIGQTDKTGIGQTDLGRGQGIRCDRPQWSGKNLGSAFRLTNGNFGLFGLAHTHISVCSVWTIPLLQSVRFGQPIGDWEDTILLYKAHAPLTLVSLLVYIHYVYTLDSGAVSYYHRINRSNG